LKVLSSLREFREGFSGVNREIFGNHKARKVANLPILILLYHFHDGMPSRSLEFYRKGRIFCFL
ncbi:MAG: hypothetical protein Q4C70_06930, partial [Planctomycetia bacterium]|nr:hypothetical protein [Planctomycetia bacterium]